MIDGLAEPKAGIEHDAIAADAGGDAGIGARDENAATSATTSSYTASRCMVAGSPRICIRHTAAVAGRHGLHRARRVQCVHVIDHRAPAAIAARITAGLRVSTEIGTLRASHETQLFRSRERRDRARRLRRSAPRRDASTRRRCRRCRRPRPIMAGHDRRMRECRGSRRRRQMNRA